MKYGRLVYQYNGKTFLDGTAIYNIGDNIQTFAIDNVYKQMGIDKKNIIDINFAELKNYDGEYVVLPMQGYASHYKRFNQLPVSDKIIPLFVGFEMSDPTCDDIIPCLKKYEPIGCRDEATMKLLREKGVEAYISGCLTITLPRREKEPKVKKTFIVDIPEEVEALIPKNLKENCEYISHEDVVGHSPLTKEDITNIDIHARNVLNKYRDEASIVITSRLHAAAPCVAMGIPVILVINNIDSRFSWLDKLIPIYDSDNYKNIDWNPMSVEYETIKKKIIEIVSKRLNKIMNEKLDIYSLSEYWENRERVTYNRTLVKKMEMIKTYFDKDRHFKYVIWGAGVHGKLAYTMMSQFLPNAELVAVVDKYMDGFLFGRPIIRQDDLDEKEFEYVLITSHPGRFEAAEKLTKMGMEKNREWCYFISKDVPEDNIDGE